MKALPVKQALTFIALRSVAPILPGEFPPRGARISAQLGLTDVPAAVPGPLLWTNVTRNIGDTNPMIFKVPPASAGFVRKFALDTNSPVGETYIRFRFIVNGSPKENYQAPPFNIGDVDDPADVWFELDGDDIFQVQLANLDTTIPYRVSTHTVMWSWRLPTAFDLTGTEGF